MAEDQWDVLVRRENPATTEVRAGAAPALEQGQVRLSIEQFGITSNNVTYARLGDFLNYWDHFPAPAGWGRIPAWGFATIEASRHRDYPEGIRVFGYLPMSTHLIVSPEPIHPGFEDSAPHRRSLSRFYRRYSVVGQKDPLDGIRTVIRPVFPTSLLLADIVSDAASALASPATVLTTSASSKTALGLAHVLAAREGVRTHGLTSAHRLGFVRGTGLFDSLSDYDSFKDTEVSTPVILVDFAGDKPVVTAVHERFGDDLVLSQLVGDTRAEGLLETAGLPGPIPTQLNGSEAVLERIAQVGEEAYAAAVASAENKFTDAAQHWLRADDRSGSDAVVQVLDEVFSGPLDPAVAHVLRPADDR